MANEHSLEASMAGLAATVGMHLKSDEASNARIESNTALIFQQLAALADKFDSSIRRVHEKIESENDKAMAAAHAAHALAQSAHDKIAKEKSGLLIKIITGLLGLGGAGGMGAIASKKFGGP